MATAPAIVRFVGGSVPDALATTQRMYDITARREPGLRRSRSWSSAGRRPASTSPRWCAAACCPQINTGMAGRVAGTGQVGAGLVTPPMACFTQALDALAAAARD